jgi:hypothetical protein
MFSVNMCVLLSLERNMKLHGMQALQENMPAFVLVYILCSSFNGKDKLENACCTEEKMY